MNSGQSYQPTSGDVISVLKLLHDNGVSVQNSKKAYEELQQYQANPAFCILLSYVFGAEKCPIQDIQLDGSWIQYRRLAGITLKNNLEKSEYALGEVAVKEAARCALSVLGNPTDVRIVRVAAQIVVKITALTSFNWWQECGMGSLPSLLLNDLFNAGELKTLSALYTLQYLMEDLPKEIGSASKDIIERVLTLVLDQNTQTNLRKAAFRMCSNMYEQAQLLDWNVEGLSPLQNGLIGASGTFTAVCTSLLEQGCSGDIALLVQVLRSCGLMLDYFEYFTPLPEGEMTRFIDWWICRTIDIVCSRENMGEYNIQLKTAALDLLTISMELYDRMGGEGYVFLLVEPIIQTLSNLVPALVNFIPMSRDEIDFIISNDDYRLRDVTAVNRNLSERTKDISEDTILDEDNEVSILRSSALRCIDALCIFSSKEAFPYLIEMIKNLWDADKHLKEAAIVLFGTIANGCHSEIESFLEGITQQLISTVASPSEDIFVVSIAIWSLSRILEWAYSREDRIIKDIIMVFISRVQSTSKRVQKAAVSALNTAFIIGHNMETVRNIFSTLPSLAEQVIICLPIYSDANLSLLCDLALHLFAVAENLESVLNINEAFKANRIERAKFFENSYIEVYINERPNIHVDKDIFSIDRVIAGFLTRFPDPETSVKILETWNTTLRDAVARDIKDDTDLLYDMIYTCSNFVSVTSTSTLIEWTNQTQGSLASLGFQFLVKSSKDPVKSAAITLLHRLLKSIGISAYPIGMCDKLLVILTSYISETDNPYDKLEIVRLITLIVEVYSSDLPSNSHSAFRSAVDTLRSDAYSDSRFLFSQMAYEICRTIGNVPNIVGQSRPDIVAQIMAQSDNTYDKSVATIHFVNALLTVEDVALAMLPDVMRLILSWQQAACNFPGTQEKIKSLLFLFNNKIGDQFRDYLSSQHPNIREMLLSTYDMS